MPSSSTYVFPVAEACHRDHLRYARELRDRCGIPYSFEAACVMYMLDQDAGRERGKRDYEKLWGWSEKTVRYRWGDILSTVHDWRTAYGRWGDEQRETEGKTQGRGEKRKGDGGATVGRRKGDEQRETEGKTQGRGDGGATVGRLRDDRSDPDYIGRNRLQTTEKKRGAGRKRKVETDPMSIMASLHLPPHLDTDHFRNCWLKWIIHRIALRKVKAAWSDFFQTQIDTMLSTLPHDDAVHVVEHSTGNGYQGLFPDRVRRSPSQSPTSQSYMLPFDLAAAHAQRAGLTRWQKITRHYRDQSGKLYFVFPEHFSSPIPAGYSLIGGAE